MSTFGTYYEFDCLKKLFINDSIDIVGTEFNQADGTLSTHVLKHKNIKEKICLSVTSGKIVVVNFLRVVKTFEINIDNYASCRKTV